MFYFWRELYSWFWRLVVHLFVLLVVLASRGGKIKEILAAHQYLGRHGSRLLVVLVSA